MRTRGFFDLLRLFDSDLNDLPENMGLLRQLPVTELFAFTFVLGAPAPADAPQAD